MNNPKFPIDPRWGENNNINEIQGLIDLITDEYGNYYTAYETTMKDSKLEKIVLVHILYHETFTTVFKMEEVKQEYQNSHIGEFLLDRLHGHIRELEKENRKIFTIQDLVNNGTEIRMWDITHYMTRNKGK